MSSEFLSLAPAKDVAVNENRAAVTIAADGVGRWFSAIATDRAMMPSGFATPDIGIQDCCLDVYDVLKAESLDPRLHLDAAYCPRTDTEEAARNDERYAIIDLALDAGYLVGVQVGLRLAGGAR